MSCENIAIGLCAEQIEKFRALIAQEGRDSSKRSLPAASVLQQVGLTSEQIATITDYAAAEDKANKDFDELPAQDLLDMIQRRDAIVGALPNYTACAIGALNKRLSRMRHDLNNNLAMMLAAAELVKLKPSMAEKMLDRLIEQPGKMTAQIKEFSAEFEKTLGISRR